MNNEFAKRILEHFRNGGTLDDSYIAALYRMANGLGPETKTDPAVVGRWAFDVVAHLPMNAVLQNNLVSPAILPRTRRETGTHRRP